MRSRTSGGRGDDIVVYAIAGLLGAFSDPKKEKIPLARLGKRLLSVQISSPNGGRWSDG